MTVAVQGEAQLALIQELYDRQAGTAFDITHRLLKDSELGLPPGTLGRHMATAIGKPAEIFADVPTLVTLLTFSDESASATCAERIHQLVELTAIGRQAAASSAARALILYSSDRVLPPEEFLRISEPRTDGSVAHLLVWLGLQAANGDLATRGLEAFGLPEVVMALGPQATDAEADEAMRVVFSVAQQLLQSQAPPTEGTLIGRAGATTHALLREGAMIRVSAARPEPSVWKRLFH